MKLIECVPNISEGRNKDIINQIIQPIKDNSNVNLLDVDSQFHLACGIALGYANMNNPINQYVTIGARTLLIIKNWMSPSMDIQLCSLNNPSPNTTIILAAIKANIVVKS